RAMSERLRVLVIVLIMVVLSLTATGSTIWFLYRAAFDQQRVRLVEAAKSEARQIEAIAEEEKDHEDFYVGGVEAITIRQIEAAFAAWESESETSEIAVAKRQGDLMVFLLHGRSGADAVPDSFPFDSKLAEPMQRALSGQSGAMVALDYRGKTVLAAYESVRVLDLGIVAKIDLEEVQAPYKRAGIVATSFAVTLVLVGAFLLVGVSRPLVKGLEERSRRLEEVVSELGESERRYRSIFDLAAVGIAHVSLEGRFVRVNRRLCEIAGYTPEEMLELAFQDITHADDLEADLHLARRAIAGEIAEYSTERRFYRKDGSVVWVNLTVSLARDEDGRPLHFISVVEDITSRKDAERALQGSLKEKEVLLREIHHRVKNNMQVISSLLNLQSRGINDPALEKVFHESQTRVRAMAMIHEVLYESGDLAAIDLAAYVTKLARSLIRFYGAQADRIRLQVNAEAVSLGIDEIVPCGLVINELLSNSLKYAFPDGRRGKVEISARPTEAGEIVLVVCDDGIGLPPGLDIRKTETMGMGIVVGLVENQLGGRVELDRSDGTCFTIMFCPKTHPASVGGGR
ncbi:MAG: PAS domain S-box protein, partial [Acidobacteriota bacterium]